MDALYECQNILCCVCQWLLKKMYVLRAFHGSLHEAFGCIVIYFVTQQTL